MKNSSSETYLVRPDSFIGNITPTRRSDMRVYEVNMITSEYLSGLGVQQQKTRRRMTWNKL